MNRTQNQGMLDANSQLPHSYVYSPLITANTTTQIGITGAGILHGFLISTPGATTNHLIAYDTVVTTTSVGLLPLVTTTIIGYINTTTSTPGFVSAGDVIFNTGLIIVTTTGTAGVVQVIYL